MHTIIGIGEVLWDCFEDGKVLGGAPCNLAYHVHAFGHRGALLSRVGTDEAGDQIIESLTRLGLPTDLVQRDREHPSGVVLVKLDDAGVPEFTIVEDVAWDYLVAGDAWVAAAHAADAVCFGTLAQRNAAGREAIRRVLDAAAKGGALIVCDLNFRQHFYSRGVLADSLARSSVLKLNDSEVVELRRMLGGPADEEQFVRALMSDHNVHLTCVTRGADGCTLYSPDDTVAAPVPPTSVVDTVGSGDAFTAGLIIKHLDGRPLGAIAQAANLLGAFVATRRGATPEAPRDLVERFTAV